MPRVISYTRFSSKKQAAGDSYRRQTEMAMRWCKEKGYELDTSLVLEDLGVSAYSGANAAIGALGVLQAMVFAGKLEKGTILLIEAFDRMTRMSLPDAQEMLLSLINRGITVVTLTDGNVWTRETLGQLDKFLMSVLTLHRGFQESDYKSKRLREVFENARATGEQAKFGAAPGWFRRATKESPWEVIPERAESVRKVFELAAAGMGSKAIAQRANAEGWPVPTRLQKTGGRWHAQMPGQLLRNRAVLGEHEHRKRTHEANAKHWHGEASGIVYANYYPRVIDDDLWHRARAAIETRKAAPGRRDVNYYNIFAGMLFCGRCGAPIQRKHERRGYSRAQLVCSDRIAGLTGCPPGSARQTDEHLLDAIFAHSLEVLGSDPSGDLQEQIAALDARIIDKQRESERIVEAIATAGGPVAVLARKAGALQTELDALQTEREALRREQAVRSGGNVGAVALHLEDAVAQLYDDSEAAREARAALHLRVARLTETVWLWPYEVAILKLKHGDKLIPVPLPPKELPSRANPNAKYHRPPKPRELKPQPLQMLALAGVLTPPEPRRSSEQRRATPTKPYLLSEGAPEPAVPPLAAPVASVEPEVDWGDEDNI